jgi:hypothetical protein
MAPPVPKGVAWGASGIRKACVVLPYLLDGKRPQHDTTGAESISLAVANTYLLGGLQHIARFENSHLGIT